MRARHGLAAMAACASVALLVLAGLAGLPTASVPSAFARDQIPAAYLGLYQRAALTCPGLDWTVLAAIGAIESDHGRAPLPGVRRGANPAGAVGPMQFLPATFAAYDHPVAADPWPTEPGGATPPSPYDPTDAIYAAARYLCASHVTADLEAAVITYNCGNPGPACQLAAVGYAAEVLATAAAYRDRAGQPAGVAGPARAALTRPGTPGARPGAIPRAGVLGGGGLLAEARHPGVLARRDRGPGAIPAGLGASAPGSPA